MCCVGKGRQDMLVQYKAITVYVIVNVMPGMINLPHTHKERSKPFIYFQKSLVYLSR